MNNQADIQDNEQALPWLSVIMPIYNGGEYLRQALHSIEEQAEPGIECLIIDDGSTDSSPEIIESFAQRLRLLQLPVQRTGNWAYNTNLALTAARGRYACFLHQDDLWLPGRIRTIKEQIRQHPDADLFLSPAQFIGPDGKRLGSWKCPLPNGDAPLPNGMLQQRLLVQNFIAIPAPVFLRNAALAVGGLDNDLWYTADWDFWLKLARHGPTVYTKIQQTAFRIHPHSQTISAARDQDDFRSQLEQVLHRHLPHCCTPTRRHRRLRRIAKFSIAVNAFLAGHLHDKQARTGPLIRQGLRLGPVGLTLYLRYSRILERSLSRLRAGCLHGS